jgi:hypothetical protein
MRAGINKEINSIGESSAQPYPMVFYFMAKCKFCGNTLTSKLAKYYCNRVCKYKYSNLAKRKTPVPQKIQREGEIWMPVVGYEGLYEISNYGNLRSLDRYTINRGVKAFVLGWELKYQLSTNGYYMAFLAKESTRKNTTIHSIVAKAFIPNPDNKPYVNHKNGIKTDNMAENLEWVTPKENTHHALTMGLLKTYGEDSKFCKILTADVLFIRYLKHIVGHKTTYIHERYYDYLTIGHIRKIVSNRAWNTKKQGENQ